MVFSVQVSKALLHDLIQRLSAASLSVCFARFSSDNGVKSLVSQPGALCIALKGPVILLRCHETVVVDAKSRALVGGAEC